MPQPASSALTLENQDMEALAIIHFNHLLRQESVGLHVSLAETIDIILCLQSIREKIPTHLEQCSEFHHQIEAECFGELQQQADGNTAATQHLFERVGSLDTMQSVVKQLQDLRKALLDNRRERHVDQDQEATVTTTIAHLEKQRHELQSRRLSGCINESCIVAPQQLEIKGSKLRHLVGCCFCSNLRLQVLDCTTYNGILMWKIDDFERRRREVVDGITMLLSSSPFYTSSHGYKMRARIYLNGDGLGKTTHFSIFFVIMRGPYDALLPWPFRQKVTLTLLNQTGKNHVTDHFRPDPHSSSFQRPDRRELNIGSGFPMFVRIDHLLNGGFVKDNAAFIRIVVDTSDLPKIIPL